jgi:hypothetical protein
MALCDNCAFFDEQYDKFRQDYNDAVPLGSSVEQHFCPMYDDHIPNGIYYDGEDCEFYVLKG